MIPSADIPATDSVTAPEMTTDEGPDEFPRMEVGDKMYLRWKPVQAGMDVSNLVIDARVVLMARHVRAPFGCGSRASARPRCCNWAMHASSPGCI